MSAQTEGRKANGAQPLGERKGLVSDRGTTRTGQREQQTAGPDGPDPSRAAQATTGKPKAAPQPSGSKGSTRTS
jgi:hypothetical protein